MTVFKEIKAIQQRIRKNKSLYLYICISPTIVYINPNITSEKGDDQYSET